MAIATWPNAARLSTGTTLKSSANVTGSTDNPETAVEVGGGRFEIVTTVSAIDVASNDEHYTVVLEANTRDATSTWYEIGVLFAGGAKETTGKAADDAADEYVIDVFNPYDYQVRVRTYLIGSTASGITFGAVAYPLPVRS